MRLGFIGLGNMGSELARHLLAAGHMKEMSGWRIWMPSVQPREAITANWLNLPGNIE